MNIYFICIVLSEIIVLPCASAQAPDLELRIAELERLAQAQAAQIEKLKKNQDTSRKLDSSNPSAFTLPDQSTLTAEDIVGALDHIWLLNCGALVMFMQAGFAMLEAGACRAKNVQNILLKNVMDVCVGTIGWYVMGWAIAFGGPYDGDGNLKNQVIGGGDGYFASGFSTADDSGNQDGGVPPGTLQSTQLNWFFQWTFCSAAATIVSGGVAERIMFPGYIGFSFLMCFFIYPVVVSWTWGGGWLGSVNEAGFIDFAGSGIVHLCGGVGALMGAIIVGPRDGRWDPAKEAEFDPHSLPLIVIGTFVLWFGWYGFNCGSTLSLHLKITGAQAALVAMNTTVSAACGGLSVLIIRALKWKRSTGKVKYDLGGMCNGILVGLVSVTAGCSTVESGSAFAIGVVGSFLYEFFSDLLRKLRIDDPLDAFPVHGVSGAWGVLAAALFDFGKGFDYANGSSGFSCLADDDGNCISGIWTQLLLSNVLEIVAISSWVIFWSAFVLIPMRMMGCLTASQELQLIGMDALKHSPTKAYCMDNTALDV